MTFDDFWSGSQADIEDAVNKATAMIEDIYTVDSLQVKKIAVRVRSTTPFTAVFNGANVEFDDPATMSDAYDTDGFWSIANPKLLTVPAGLGGFYRCVATVRFNGGSLAQLEALLLSSPYGVIAQEVAWTDGKAGFSFVQDVELDAGDWVTLSLRATVNRNVSILTASSPTLSLHKLDGRVVPIT